MAQLVDGKPMARSAVPVLSDRSKELFDLANTFYWLRSIGFNTNPSRCGGDGPNGQWGSTKIHFGPRDQM